MKFEIATQKFPIPQDIKKHEVKDLEKFSQMLAKRHDFVKSVFINRKKLRESEQKILPIIVLIDDISNDLKKNRCGQLSENPAFLDQKDWRTSTCGNNEIFTLLAFDKRA